MFVLNDDMSIYATRGDTVFFTVCATDGSGAKYKFKPDDVVRFKAFEKKACENVVAQKDFVITEETEEVNILLTEDDTRFGKIISKPRDYWYEIELNPFTNPQTIIGYDDDGPKVFRLYPESKNIVKDLNEEEFYADAELSPTSTNPVQNQAVTRAVANLTKHIDDGLKGVKDSVLSEEEALRIRGELRVLDSDVASLKSDLTKYLPLEGGTLSGNVEVNGDSTYKTVGVKRQIKDLQGVTNTGLATFGVGNWSEIPNAQFAVNFNGVDICGLVIDPTNKQLCYADLSNYTLHTLFGEHNKPTGTYTGNGSTTSRTISTGGMGWCALVIGGGYSFIVTPSGAFGIYQGTTSIQIIKEAEVYFSGGSLRLATASDLINKNGTTYTYQVL